MHLHVSSAKWRPFCLGLNVSTNVDLLSTGALGSNFSEISPKTKSFSFKKFIWKCLLQNGSHICFVLRVTVTVTYRHPEVRLEPPQRHVNLHPWQTDLVGKTSATTHKSFCKISKKFGFFLVVVLFFFWIIIFFTLHFHWVNDLKKYFIHKDTMIQDITYSTSSRAWYYRYTFLISRQGLVYPA